MVAEGSNDRRGTGTVTIVSVRNSREHLLSATSHIATKRTVVSRGLPLVHLFWVPPPLSRIMRPDDANIAGNVHGGTILKMIEEAGAIISTRHCNSQSGVRALYSHNHSGNTSVTNIGSPRPQGVHEVHEAAVKKA